MDHRGGYYGPLQNVTEQLPKSVKKKQVHIHCNKKPPVECMHHNCVVCSETLKQTPPTRHCQLFSTFCMTFM